MDPLIGASLISGAANLAGGFMSSSGAASANAANLQQANMINQQMLAAQQAQHGQNTAFMEDQQAFNREERQFAQAYNSVEAEKARTFNSNEAAAARVFNSSEAEVNRQFQERMANTAYQRAMADMKAAGLNPILAYKMGGATAMSGGAASGPAASGGAASGSGASSGMASSSGSPSLRAASIVNDKEAIGRAMGNAVQSAVDVAKTIQGVDVMKEEVKLKGEQTRRVGYETSNIDANTQKQLQETQTNKQYERNLIEENKLIKANTATAISNAVTAAGDAAATTRYGGKYAPNTWERMLRSIQESLERGTHIPLPEPMFKAP